MLAYSAELYPLSLSISSPPEFFFFFLTDKMLAYNYELGLEEGSVPGNENLLFFAHVILC